MDDGGTKVSCVCENEPITDGHIRQLWQAVKYCRDLKQAVLYLIAFFILQDGEGPRSDPENIVYT